jgi:enoyl-CoA hydratase/carnithine racemase
MGHGTLVIDDVSGARWVTGSRPEKVGALNRDVLSDLERAAADARDDAAVGVIVFTGSGEKALPGKRQVPFTGR